MIHQTDFRVSYADTDQMGVVYYANYLVLFERGRTELMRGIGLCYKDLEKEEVYLPAMEVQVKYLAPAHYDDLLKIKTWVSDLGRASLSFAYQIVKADTGVLLAQGSTKHPFVDRRWKPIRTPERVRRALSRGADRD